MEEKDVLRLYETSRRLVHETPMAFHRQLLSVVNWGSRLICIKGAKGTGKTTLLLQHIREAFGDADDKCLFVSLDNLWFAAHDVIDLADWHWKHGGTHLFLDEVHHLKSWQTIVKNIYVPADEGNNSVDIDWYAMNVSSRDSLTYTIDAICLGL